MKKKNKVKRITIEINVKGRKEGVRKSLPPYLFERLESVLRRECATTRDHWRKGGWKLSWRLIEDGIYREVFGGDLNWYVLGRFLKTGCTWEYRTNSLGYEEPMLVADKRRKQVTRKRGRNG